MLGDQCLLASGGQSGSNGGTQWGDSVGGASSGGGEAEDASTVEPDEPDEPAEPAERRDQFLLAGAFDTVSVNGGVDGVGST